MAQGQLDDQQTFGVADRLWGIVQYRRKGLIKQGGQLKAVA